MPDFSEKQSDDSRDHIFVAGVGASAGGITALRQFFEQVRPNSGIAYVVILHLSPEHESNLAALIQASSSIPVKQVTESVAVQPDHVYVIPPNHYLVMTDGVVKLAELHRTSSGHSSIDLFFRTLADAYGKDAVAIVLSGSGTDGVIGIGELKSRGGRSRSVPERSRVRWHAGRGHQ